MRPLDEQLRHLIDDDVTPITEDEARSRARNNPTEAVHSSPRRWPKVAAAAVVASAVVTAGVVALRDTDDSESRIRTTATPPPVVARPAQIAAVTTDGRLVVLDSETGTLVRELATDAVANTRDADGHWSLSTTPDGSTIYYTRRVADCCTTIAAVPSQGGPSINPLGGGCCIRYAAVSPDGRWLAFSGVPGRSDAGKSILIRPLSHLADATAGRQWGSDAPLNLGVGQLAWAPNSIEIAYVQADTPDGTPPRVLDVTSPETTRLDNQQVVPQSDAQRWAGYLGETGDFLVIDDAGDELGESLSAAGKPQRISALDGQTGAADRVLFELDAARDAASDASGQHVLATNGDDALYRWSQGERSPTKIGDHILAATWLPGQEHATSTPESAAPSTAPASPATAAPLPLIAAMLPTTSPGGPPAHLAVLSPTGLEQRTIESVAPNAAGGLSVPLESHSPREVSREA